MQDITFTYSSKKTCGTTSCHDVIKGSPVLFVSFPSPSSPSVSSSLLPETEHDQEAFRQTPQTVWDIYFPQLICNSDDVAVVSICS